MGEFTPDEAPEVIFAEKAWLQGALLAAVAYGVELTLFAMSFYHLLKRQFSRSTSRKKVDLFFLAYITIMFILSTLFYASNAQFTQLAFIDNRNFPGGPNTYEQVMFSIPVDELGNVCAIMTTWLCDALLVWRCQVIFAGSRFPIWTIMMFPYLLFLGSFVMGILFLLQVSSTSPWTPGTVNWTIPFLALSLSLNIIITTAIVIRVLLHRRRLRGVLGSNHGQHYISVAAMIVESASIFSVFSLLFIIPFGLNNSLNQIFFQPLSVVQIIAMLLIIFRVAQGKGWTSDVTNQISTANGPSIRFASAPSSTTVFGRSKHSDGLTIRMDELPSGTKTTTNTLKSQDANEIEVNSNKESMV